MPVPSRRQRPKSAPSTRSSQESSSRFSHSFLYASSWLAPSDFRKLCEDSFHADVDGLYEESPFCSFAASRRMKKILTSGTQLCEWKTQHVLDWLEYSGFAQHRELFRKAAVDGKSLCKMTSDILKKQVGIGRLGHRKQVLQKLDELKCLFSDASVAQGTSASLQSHSVGNLDTSINSIQADKEVPTEELLSLLKSARDRWVQDRQLLVAILGPKPIYLQLPMEKWTKHDVCDWISHLGLCTYRKHFVQGSIDGDMLSNMTLSSLQNELGIESLVHRRFLIENITKLNQESRDDNPEDAPVIDSEQQQLVQSQLRNCDFNITRLDQRIAKVKKSLGVDEPHTKMFLDIQEICKDEQEKMRADLTTEENWWEKQYNEHVKKEEKRVAAIRKSKQEEDDLRRPKKKTSRQVPRRSDEKWWERQFKEHENNQKKRATLIQKAAQEEDALRRRPANGRSGQHRIRKAQSEGNITMRP